MAEEAKVPTVPAPAEELHPDGAPILKGAQATTFWPTEAKAVEIANKRTKGARRAYSVKTPDGKLRFATASHIHFLMESILEGELKYCVTEVGKPPRASGAPVTADAILAAINSMPEAERELIRKQMEPILKNAKK